MKVKLTKEQQELLNTFSTVLRNSDTTYMYMPYWFKSTDEANVFEILTFEKLPKDLIQMITVEREK